MLLRLAPVLFVLIWSTGWISARAAAPLADPLTFLTARFGLAVVLLAIIMMVLGVKFPATRRVWFHGIVTGIFLHAIYLGGIWVSIDRGMPTALAGIIAALQPLLTACVAVVWLSERLTRYQWLGLVLGFAGILVALLPDLFQLEAEALRADAGLIGLNVMAIASVTLGSLYQKRFLPEGDLRAITLVQYIGASLLIAPLALTTETLYIELSLQTALVMGWAVFGLSFAAIGLYLLLIRHGAVSRAATLIYLIPPLVAVEAFLLFGESISALAIAGLLVTVVGVYLVSQSGRPEKAGQ